MYNDPNDEFLIQLRESFKDSTMDISEYKLEPLDIQKGEFNNFYGKRHTEESKLKISQSKLGKSTNKGSVRPWAKDNLKQIKHRAYGQFRITEPQGNTITITNLKQYCLEQGLNYTSMSSLASGKWPCETYKGYKAEKLGYIKIHR
jgi:hypothetical protein